MIDDGHLLAALPLGDAFRRTEAEIAVERLQRIGAMVLVDAVLLERGRGGEIRTTPSPLVPNHLPADGWARLADGLLLDLQGSIADRFSRSFVAEVRHLARPGSDCLLAVLDHLDVAAAGAALRGTRLVYGVLPESVLDDLGTDQRSRAPATLTLSVWRFAAVAVADQAEQRLRQLASRAESSIHGAAVVSWPTDHHRPVTRRLPDLGAGSLGDEFWGLFLGLLVYAPMLGRACGSDVAALSSALGELGIADDDIARLRAFITPGSATLLVVADDDVVDDALLDVDLVANRTRSSLSRAHEDRILDLFAPA